MSYKFLSSFLAGLFLLLTSCKTSAPEAEHAAAEQVTAAATIPMTAEQLEMAGVVLGRPEQRVISTHIDCTGKVEAPPQSLASVYSPVAGFIQSVQHLPGDLVRKGTLLTSLRHPDLITLQRAFLRLQSRIPFLEKDYERKKTLAESDATSVKALQEAQLELEMAQVELKGLKAELDLIGISTKKLVEEGEIQTTLNLYAPVSGYVTKMDVNLGKLVTPNDLLFEIIDREHLHLELQVFAKDINAIQPDQRIVCNVPGDGQNYTAHVHLVGKMIDPESKTAMVHGHFDQEPVPITAGTYLEARIFTGGEEVMAVPNEALVRSGGETYVFVQHPEGFEKRTVLTGRTDDEYTEVLNLELAGGERIAIAGAYYINGSEPVE